MERLKEWWWSSEANAPAPAPQPTDLQLAAPDVAQISSLHELVNWQARRNQTGCALIHGSNGSSELQPVCFAELEV